MAILTQYSFSDSSKQAMHIASQLAKENMHATYGAAHLLKALLHKDLSMLKFLEANGADIYYLEEWAEIRIEQYPRTAKPTDEPGPDESCDALFNEADHLHLKLQYHSIEPECLLIAISTPGVSFAYEQLKTYPITSAQLLQWYQNTSTGKSDTGGKTNGMANKPSPNATYEALGKYCIDKLAQAKGGELYPVIGRDKEIRQICAAARICASSPTRMVRRKTS